MIRVNIDKLKDYNINDLIEIVKELYDDNQRKELYINELEKRLEKLNMKPEIEGRYYDVPETGDCVTAKIHYIPEIRYIEYEENIDDYRRKKRI